MKYLHTMVRVTDIEDSLRFYCEDSDSKRCAAPTTRRAATRWSSSRHPATRAARSSSPSTGIPRSTPAGAISATSPTRVDDIYATCQHLMDMGVHHQPPAARRPHGVRPLARRHLGRADPGWRCAAAAGALELDAQHRQVVAVAVRAHSTRTLHQSLTIPLSGELHPHALAYALLAFGHRSCVARGRPWFGLLSRFALLSR